MQENSQEDAKSAENATKDISEIQDGENGYVVMDLHERDHLLKLDDAFSKMTNALSKQKLVLKNKWESDKKNNENNNKKKKKTEEKHLLIDLENILLRISRIGLLRGKKIEELEKEQDEAISKIKLAMELESSATKTRNDANQLRNETQLEMEEINKQKEIIKKELAKVEPQLQLALSAVEDINDDALNELISLPKPPSVVKNVLTIAVGIVNSSKFSFANGMNTINEKSNNNNNRIKLTSGGKTGTKTPRAKKKLSPKKGVLKKATSVNNLNTSQSRAVKSRYGFTFGSAATAAAATGGATSPSSSKTSTTAKLKASASASASASTTMTPDRRRVRRCNSTRNTSTNINIISPRLGNSNSGKKKTKSTKTNKNKSINNKNDSIKSNKSSKSSDGSNSSNSSSSSSSSNSNSKNKNKKKEKGVKKKRHSLQVVSKYQEKKKLNESKKGKGKGKGKEKGKATHRRAKTPDASFDIDHMHLGLPQLTIERQRSRSKNDISTKNKKCKKKEDRNEMKKEEKTQGKKNVKKDVKKDDKKDKRASGGGGGGVEREKLGKRKSSYSKLTLSMEPRGARPKLARSNAQMDKLKSRDFDKIVTQEWNDTRKLLRRINFKKKVLSFDAKTLNKKICTRLEKEFLILKDFEVGRANQASKVLAPLVKWIRSLVGYSTIWYKIAPLAEKVSALEKEIQHKTSNLEKLEEMYEESHNKVIKIRGEILEMAGYKRVGQLYFHF